MSHHFFYTLHEKIYTRVTMGWDHLQQTYFMTIEKEADTGTPFWSSVHQDFSQLKDFDVLLEVLKRFDIRIPQQMIEEVRADGDNNVGDKEIRHIIIGGMYDRQELNEL